MASVTEHITMHVDVTGVQTWKIRVWVAVQFIRLAAFVMNCNVVVNIVEQARCEHVWKPDVPYCLKCKLPARDHG